MSKAKLDLKTKSDLALLKFARDHRDAILNNPNFPNPLPTPVVFNADLEGFSDKVTAIAAAETALQVLRAEKDQLRKSLESDFADRASYVDIESKGAETLILSVGFQIHAAPTPTTSIDAPSGIIATMGNNEGEILLSCDAVYRAKSYIAEVREHSEVEAPGPWGNPKVATRSSLKFTGLTSGKKYAFRIRALGPNELESPWSAEAVSMVP